MIQSSKFIFIAGAVCFCVPAFGQEAKYLENNAGLEKFYSSLSSLKDGSKKSPIHIVMIGDSHTASDLISASLRFELQTKFGNAGRGFIQAGYPYDGFSPLGLNIKSPKKWTIAKSFPASKADDGPFGLGGFRARVSLTDEKYALRSEVGNEFDSIAICANSIEPETRLGFEIFNSQSLYSQGEISFNQANGEINCQKAMLPKAANELSLNSVPKQKPLGLASIGIWREGPGIILSSFGIVGSQAYDLASRNLMSMASEFSSLPPNLIIIEFGTNEGFDPNFDAAKYATILEGQIKSFQNLAPNASILLIGAPDANKKASSATGTQCAILNEEIGKKFPNISTKDINADYYSPPNLKLVRKVQKEVSNKLGVAIWDWFAFMGGECSANSLSLKADREVLNDRVHFSKIGAQKVGKAIANDIISGFELGSGPIN